MLKLALKLMLNKKYPCLTNKYLLMISLPTHTKSYLGEDAVYNFINSMIEESKFCTDVMKNKLTKNL